MRKYIAFFAVMLITCFAASAQIQTEIEYGVTERNFLSTGAAVAYDFDYVPFTAGVRVCRETGIDGYSVYNPTSYASAFFRAYSGKGALRIGCELDLELSQAHSYFSCTDTGYDNRRAVYFRPSIACFASDNFGISLNVFRFGWWSDPWPGCGDYSSTIIYEDGRADFRTVSVSLIYKFARIWPW